MMRFYDLLLLKTGQWFPCVLCSMVLLCRQRSETLAQHAAFVSDHFPVEFTAEGTARAPDLVLGRMRLCRQGK